MKIILGSSSEFRRTVLREAGIEFEAVSPEIDEKSIRSESLYELPLLIAREKMKALQAKVNESAIVITADQIVICKGELREKPASKEEAIKFLRSYGEGSPAETVSAVVVYNFDTGKIAEGVDIAKTFFNAIPEEAMLNYVDSGEAYKSAGGFDHKSSYLEPFINKLEGTSDSVSGLPLDLLKKLIKEVS
jgi:septum formation protein